MGETPPQGNSMRQCKGARTPQQQHKMYVTVRDHSLKKYCSRPAHILTYQVFHLCCWWCHWSSGRSVPWKSAGAWTRENVIEKASENRRNEHWASWETLSLVPRHEPRKNTRRQISVLTHACRELLAFTSVPRTRISRAIWVGHWSGARGKVQILKEM